MPVPFVDAVRSRLVALLCNTTVASGTTPPDVSYTVPLIEAIAWPRALPGNKPQRPDNNTSPTPKDQTFEFLRKLSNVIVAPPDLERASFLSPHQPTAYMHLESPFERNPTPTTHAE